MNGGNEPTSNEGMTIDELRQQIAQSEAEKAKFDAETAAYKSQKARTEAEVSAQVAKLIKRKAIADAAKELVESERALREAQSGSALDLNQLTQQQKLAVAQKALAEAQTQAALASYIGTTTAGPYTDSVEVKDKGGTIESRLLAAKAVKAAATKIADAVKDKADPFFIFEADEYPGFENLAAFRFRAAMIEKAYQQAGISMAEPAGTLASFAVVPVAAAVSAGLQAFANILGYLKTDYTTQGIDVSLNNTVLTFAVAGELADKAKRTHLPAIQNPTAHDVLVKDFVKELDDFVKLNLQANTKIEQLNGEIADKKKEAASKDGQEKEELLTVVTELEKSSKRLGDINQSLGDLLASLLTTKQDGTVPLDSVLREFSLEASLKKSGDNAALLILKLENSGGGYLNKKNLWTGLGVMPLFHMGGATVSFLLLKISNGAVLAGNVYPVHSGFVAADKVQGQITS